MQKMKNHSHNAPKKSWADVAVYLLILPEPKDHPLYEWPHQAPWTQINSAIDALFPN